MCDPGYSKVLSGILFSLLVRVACNISGRKVCDPEGRNKKNMKEQKNNADNIGCYVPTIKPKGSACASISPKYGWTVLGP